jgi:hypothetical protein
MTELGIEASFGSADAMLQAHISANGAVAAVLHRHRLLCLPCISNCAQGL